MTKTIVVQEKRLNKYVDLFSFSDIDKAKECIHTLKKLKKQYMYKLLIRTEEEIQ
jgi:hypothetical protein